MQNDNELMRNERNVNFNRVIEIKKKSEKEEQSFIVQCARDLACMSEIAFT